MQVGVSTAAGGVFGAVGYGVSKAVSGVRALCQGKISPEVYYRSMSQGDYDYLRMTGELPATGETFISPSKSYSSNYNGTTVKFRLNAGTTSQLESIGLRNGSCRVADAYPNMPKASGVK